MLFCLASCYSRIFHFVEYRPNSTTVDEVFLSSDHRETFVDNEVQQDLTSEGISAGLTMGKLYKKQSSGKMIQLDITQSHEENEALNSQKDEESLHDMELHWQLPREEIDLENHVAEGFFRVVWKGRFDGRDVAIKERKPSSAEEVDFMAEPRALMHLQHKSVIEFIGVVFSKPELTVTEFADNGSLIDYLHSEEGKVTRFADHMRMASQVASAMDYIGQRGYIHCNLRAGTVLVCADMTCKVGMFTMAKYVGKDGKYEARGAVNVPTRWMPPEALKHGQFSVKADVWSFGVMVSEILTYGAKPYPDLSNKDVLVKVPKGHRIEKPPKCPNDLFCELQKCWYDKPDIRPSFQWLETIMLNYYQRKRKEESPSLDSAMKVIAIFDYKTDEQNQISFKRGDIITDVSVWNEGGWWFGILDGVKGYFPRSYVEVIF